MNQLFGLQHRNRVGSLCTSVLQEKMPRTIFRCEAFALVVMCDMIRSA